MPVRPAHTAFLAAHDRAHLSTIGPDGSPQVKPLGYRWNPAPGTIDIGGYDNEASAKYRNVGRQPRVAVVVDDAEGDGEGATANRFVEVRGLAEQAGPLIRVHPTRVTSWNVEPVGGFAAYDVEGSAGPGPAAEAVTEFVATIQDGLDRGDADRYDSWMVPDVLWGSPYGMTLGSLAPLTAAHHRQMTESVVGRSAYEVVDVRSPIPGVALAQVRRRTLEGDAFSEMALYVLVELGGRWQLVAGHNTPIGEPPPVGPVHLPG